MLGSGNSKAEQAVCPERSVIGTESNENRQQPGNRERAGEKQAPESKRAFLGGSRPQVRNLRPTCIVGQQTIRGGVAPPLRKSRVTLGRGPGITPLPAARDSRAQIRAACPVPPVGEASCESAKAGDRIGQQPAGLVLGKSARKPPPMVGHASSRHSIDQTKWFTVPS